MLIFEWLLGVVFGGFLIFWGWGFRDAHKDEFHPTVRQEYLFFPRLSIVIGIGLEILLLLFAFKVVKLPQ